MEDHSTEQPKKNRAAVALGRKGGKARVSKGFANPDVMARAIATRAARAAEKKLKKDSESS